MDSHLPDCPPEEWARNKQDEALCAPPPVLFRRFLSLYQCSHFALSKDISLFVPSPLRVEVPNQVRCAPTDSVQRSQPALPMINLTANVCRIKTFCPRRLLTTFFFFTSDSLHNGQKMFSAHALDSTRV